LSMRTMTATNALWPTLCRTFQVLASVLLLAGCTGLSTQPATSQAIYVLEAQAATAPAQLKRNLVLAVGLPQARPGFDTPQMAYVRQPHELSYFVTSRWADTPSRMLGPLLMQAMEQTGSFRAVVQAQGTVRADVRLDTELVRLWQDFATKPSRVQLTLRAQLIDVRGQRVLAVKQFDEIENAASDDASGGVTATNRLLQRMLGQLADFCVTESVIQ